MKRHGSQWMLLCMMLFLTVSTACEYSGSIQQREDPCDARRFIEISYEITKQGVNESGTQFCHYTAKFTNTDDYFDVYMRVQRFEMYGLASDQKTFWEPVRVRIRPGDVSSQFGFVEVYDDEHYDSPFVKAPVKAAFIAEDPACTANGEDTDFLNQVAVTLDQACPFGMKP